MFQFQCRFSRFASIALIALAISATTSFAQQQQPLKVDNRAIDSSTRIPPVVGVQGQPYPNYNCTNLAKWIADPDNHGGHLECKPWAYTSADANLYGITVATNDTRVTYKVGGGVACRCAKGFTGTISYAETETFRSFECQFLNDWVQTSFGADKLTLACYPVSPPTDSGMSATTKAAIGGGVAGGAVVLAVAGVAIACYVKRRKAAASTGNDVSMA